MANNLDGIKKLTPEEIKRNRKIVLDYIGEKDVESTEELTKEFVSENRPVVAVSNQVDGVRKTTQPVVKPEKIRRVESIKKEISEKAKHEAEEAKKEIAKKAKLEAEKRAMAEAEKRWREKLKLEEKLKEAERIKRENERLAEIKRAEEIKRIKEEVKLANLKAAAKRKIKRQKAVRLFKKKLSDKINKNFVVIKKNLIYGALYLIVFLMSIYVIFCLLVLRFKVDNSIMAKMERLVPVPAAFTSRGIINYNDWRDFNLAGKKNDLAGWLILKKLSKKYGLPVNSPDKALGIAFTKDEDFNQAGLLRIRKIKELLKNDDNLEKLSKYADEFSDVVYYDDESVVEKFGPAVLDLNNNQLSDIIFRDNGYYIAQIVARLNWRLGIKYLFVGASKTLSRYLSEKTAETKILILVN